MLDVLEDQPLRVINVDVGLRLAVDDDGDAAVLVAHQLDLAHPLSLESEGGPPTVAVDGPSCGWLGLVDEVGLDDRAGRGLTLVVVLAGRGGDLDREGDLGGLRSLCPRSASHGCSSGDESVNGARVAGVAG
ncbi:hypothetical protein GCM10022199_09130 [Marihabitans asiaticum]